MLFQICNGSLSFGDKQIFSHIDMEIKGRDKIAIIGPNGTGKSSLLKVIQGELALDRDDHRIGKEIRTSHALRIGQLTQDTRAWQHQTIEEILLEGFFNELRDNQTQAIEDMDFYQQYSSDRFYYEQRYHRMLQDFGFEASDQQKKLSELSGGEQTKIMLVRLLLMCPDILLLDEPTNHLDQPSIEALETHLKHYEGAVVIVSHDRYFLDQVVNLVYELEHTRLVKYHGNYSDYRIQKRKDYETRLKAYERQQAEIKKNEQLISQFKNKPRKAAFARSRRSYLERMPRIEKPSYTMPHIFTGELNPEYPGPKWMLHMKDLQVGYSQTQTLIKEIDFRIRKGQKIGIIGKNGIGKTTLLKTLMGELKPLKGNYTFGEKVQVGYYDQAQDQLPLEEKVIDYYCRQFPSIPPKEVYQKLASFLFKGELCQQKIGTLSGGEKARLRLCELLTLCPNFLILDEPTNHMDIPARETLESAFQAYTGTMLIVSHDRYFLDNVADALLVIEEGCIYYYPFGYTHYIESKQKVMDLIEKHVSIDEIPGVLTLQEQAMVAALKAVPKPKAIASKPQSDEEAYAEWRMNLAKEPMFAAQHKAEEAYQNYLKAEAHALLFAWSEDADDVEETAVLSQSSRLAYTAANDEWTDLCIKWYDLWLEYESTFL